jgi:DNA-binding transcriptional ArsR family regulator
MERFRKVHSYVTGGTTEGERSAARARAQAMAARAGMSLKEAVSKLDARTAASKPKNFMDGFGEWMEEQEPGWMAEDRRKRAERQERDNAQRAEIIRQYGSEKALFAPTKHEQLLRQAISPLVSVWDSWTDDDGTEYRYAKSIDGTKGDFYNVEQITPAIRLVVTCAYPWPSKLDGALKEVQAWDRLRLDRGLVIGGDYSSGEWEHYSEVDARITLLEHALNVGQPATSWDDVQARFDWKRYEWERQWIDPTGRDDPFLDRLEADVAALRRNDGLKSEPVASGSQKNEFRTFGRTNAEKRAAVMSMLDAHPELSDREIARRIGVSPQTVNSWRKKR